MSQYTDKRLLKLSRANGKFLSLDLGDSFKGVYLSWKVEMDEKYKKLKPTFLFRNTNGEEKQLSSGAKSFGKAMSHVIPGSLVQITRLGEGPKTNYSVKVLKAATMPANVDETIDEATEDPESFEADENVEQEGSEIAIEETDEDEADEAESLF